MKIIAHREKPFPEDLEGKLNALLNVVNSELKSVTLLHLNDIPADQSEIKRRIRKTVGGGFYLPTITCIGDYCRRSLFPFGMVAAEEMLRETDETVHVGYKLTNAGKIYGLPIVAHTLDFVLQKGKSMFEVLGSTQATTKERAPYSRVRILEEIRDRPLREMDLMNKLELPQGSINAHLKALEKADMLWFDSVGEGKKGHGFIKYEWIMGNKNTAVKTVGEFKTLTQRVAKVLQEKGQSDAQEIARITGYKMPCNITSVLSHLARQGFAERVGGWRGAEKLSNIVITDNGRYFVDNYIARVRNALGDWNALRELQQGVLTLQKSEEFASVIRGAISNYRAISPTINRKSQEEIAQGILSYLKQNPGMRPVELAVGLNRRVSGLSKMYLIPLTNSGFLRREKHGKEVRYYLSK